MFVRSASVPSHEFIASYETKSEMKECHFRGYNEQANDINKNSSFVLMLEHIFLNIIFLLTKPILPADY